jgi:hypothetical protein
MPKKKQTFVALFHTQWTSAKATVPPAALKRCEFKSGLGPMLDTLEKKWDAAADQDPVPQKALADLAAQVAKFQQVAVSYRAKVIKANADDPANGPGWFALHEALHKIDAGLVQDMKDLGVKCARTKGWVDKATFDRTAGKLGPGDGVAADSTEYRTRGFRSLATKMGAAGKDPVAFSKALDTGLRTCIPHSRDLVTSLARFTGALHTCTQNYKRHFTAKDRAGVKGDVDMAKQLVVGLAGAMPPEGKAVADAVRAMVTKMENTPVPT